MKKAWLSAILNFFLMGAGYIYNGKRILVGIMLTITAAGLTYIENIHEFNDGNTLQNHDSTAFLVLFASVFVANTALAIDAFKEAGKLNNG